MRKKQYFPYIFILILYKYCFVIEDGMIWRSIEKVRKTNELLREQ